MFKSCSRKKQQYSVFKSCSVKKQQYSVFKSCSVKKPQYSVFKSCSVKKQQYHPCPPSRKFISRVYSTGRRDMRVLSPMLGIAVSALSSRGRSFPRVSLTRLMCRRPSPPEERGIDPDRMGSLITEESLVPSETYLFGNHTSFAELGVLPVIERALRRLKRPVATSIQAATFAQLLSKRDTVIAAETGAGKSLAFLGITAVLIACLVLMSW